MTRGYRTAAWIGTGFCAALAAASVGIGAHGTGEAGVKLAVLLSARAAFVFFWPAYAGGALARFAGQAFEGLARYGRETGLAFAAALLVHLALVAWLFRVSARPPVGEAVIIYFGIGALWTYALALLSLERFGKARRSRLWRIFRTAGLEYVAVLFFLDFVVFPLQHGVSHPLEYAPFSLLIVVGPVLRLAAVLRQRRGPPPVAANRAGTTAR